jgi:hypothetical protein
MCRRLAGGDGLRISGRTLKSGVQVLTLKSGVQVPPGGAAAVTQADHHGPGDGA